MTDERKMEADEVLAASRALRESMTPEQAAAFGEALRNGLLAFVESMRFRGIIDELRRRQEGAP